MKVKDLQPNTNADIRVRICAQGQSRQIKTKKGYTVNVCPFMVGDETGTAEFSAFGKDIYEFQKLISKIIDFKDVWVKVWNEKVQISKGRAGTWEVVDDPSFPLTSEIYHG
ncbi:MAG: hypothetical protein ACTSUE_24865 [Promethearchaeota archaeon]